MLLAIHEYRIATESAKQDITGKYLKDMPYNTYYVEVNSIEFYHELMEYLEINSRMSFNNAIEFNITNYNVYLVEYLTDTSVISLINKLKDDNNRLLDNLKAKAVLTDTKTEKYNVNVDVPVEHNTIAVKKDIGVMYPFIQTKVHISATKGNTNEKSNYTNAEESNIVL
nr:MAG TPA: hypothetical protein [Crassvirales sp.]